MSRFADDFTLIIPTYNRPQSLGKLLSFLGREKFSARVLVCDSSVGENLDDSRTAVRLAKSDLDVEHEVFHPTTPVWVKFKLASDKVRTPYCALCADDDVILPDAAMTIVDRMKSDPNAALGHGWYFSFYETHALGITEIVYRSPSLDQGDAAQRMYAFAARYEALTYGIHRTTAMRSAFARIQPLDAMLTKELGSSLLVAIAGTVMRYPLIYHGRSLGASAGAFAWHPLEMLIENPENLFRTFAAQREVLADALVESAELSRADALAFADLAHVRYVSDVTVAPVLDYLVDQRLAFAPKSATLNGIWAVLAAAGKNPVAISQHGGRIARALKAMRVSSRGAARDPQQSVFSHSADGERREYVLYDAFMGAIAELGPPKTIAKALMEHLDNYVE